MLVALPQEVLHLLAEEATYIRRYRQWQGDNDLKLAHMVRLEIDNMYSITSDIRIVNK